MQLTTAAGGNTTITGLQGKRMRTDVVLWVLQAVLALFFVVASGAPKLLLPVERLALPLDLPQAFVWFIGAAEVLGGLSLILPGLLRIHTRLTPLAATGLVLVTTGATVYQLAAVQPGSALFGAAVGLLAAGVAYGRWRLVPHRAVRLRRLHPARSARSP